jgi:hypothetical protein
MASRKELQSFHLNPPLQTRSSNSMTRRFLNSQSRLLARKANLQKQRKVGFGRGQCPGHVARLSCRGNESRADGRLGQEATAEEDPPVATGAGGMSAAAPSFLARRHAGGTGSHRSNSPATLSPLIAPAAGLRSGTRLDPEGNCPCEKSDVWTLYRQRPADRSRRGARRGRSCCR